MILLKSSFIQSSLQIVASGFKTFNVAAQPTKFIEKQFNIFVFRKEKKLAVAQNETNILNNIYVALWGRILLKFNFFAPVWKLS